MNETTPIPIAVKQSLRDFVTSKMNEAKRLAMPHQQLPAIIIREVEMERFIDDLWLSINRPLLKQDEA